MSFLTPIAFALAALLPIIVAMYFLKLRREDHLVSSTYLWQRLVRDYEANAPWQRLRRNLLLVLQLLFLIALVLALARPFVRTKGAAGQSLILIVDTSTSMAATDVQPSRLDIAKAHSKELVATVADNARVTVIAAGPLPQVIVSRAQDRRQIRDAIDSLQIKHGGSDLSTALSLASAMAARQTQAEVVILSDGQVDMPETEVPAAVRYLPVGEHGDNQAVSAVSLRDLAAGQAVSLFAQITNHARQTVSRRLDIYVNNEVFDAQDLTIPAGDTFELVQNDLPPTTQQVEIRLAGADGLSIDDRAWAVRATEEPASVLLVSNGNLFLETALGLLPNVDLTRMGLADYTAQTGDDVTRGAARQPQLTIFDGTVPANLPSANALFIDPPSATAWFTPTGTINDFQFRAQNPQLVSRDDPLLRYVDLSGLQILEATSIPLPDWARPLVTTEAEVGSWPLLFAGEVEGRRAAVLAFDLRNSDLVLRPAFPLLLSNLIDFLAPDSGGRVPAQIQAGDPVVLTTPPEVDRATLAYPSGRTVTRTPAHSQATFEGTSEPGIYQIALYSQGVVVEQPRFAVNLFSPTESTIAPRATLPIAGRVGGEAGQPPQSLGQRELWRPLAVIALVLLIIEWLIYRRAAIAQLWTRLQPHLRGYRA